MPVGPYPDLGGTFTPLYQRLIELGVASRIVRLGKIGPRGRSADFAVDDLALFVGALRDSGRFCSDTPVGRILHPGKLSMREDRITDSLHIAVGRDGRVLAHLDRLSPLGRSRRQETCGYSALRVIAHNAARLWGDLFRALFGHRLDCAPLLLSLRQPGSIQPAEQPGGQGEPACPPRSSPHAGNRSGASLPVEPARRGPGRICVGFNVIDEAVHVLDTAVEPWNLHLEVRVTGTLEEDRLRSAIRTALARHPLARARKAPSRPSARRYVWAIDPEVDVDPLRVVTCHDRGALEAVRSGFVSRAIPLAESPPLRICLAHHSAGDALIMSLNHASTDATGGMRLLASIARAYASGADPLPDLDPLAVRDVGALLAAPDVPAKIGRFLLLGGKAWDLFTVPARVARDQGVDRPGYGVHRFQSSEELTGRLMSLGPRWGINELLMATLHLCIAVWNIEHGVACGRIGVLMPVNLRPADWHDEVVGNFSLLVRVLTTPQQRSLDTVLPTVVAQVEGMARGNTLAALIEILNRTGSLPIWAKRAIPALLAVTGNRLVDTAQLAYLGNVHAPASFGPDAGETTEMWFSPPARMPLGLSLGAVIASERLHLALRYRPPLLGEQAASRFAEHYLSLLGHLLDRVG